MQEAHALGLPGESQPRGITSSREAFKLCWRCGDGACNRDCDADVGSFFNSCVIVPLAGVGIYLSQWVASLRE